MFDKVVAFGDSFVAGDELCQDHLEDLEKEVQEFFGGKMTIWGDLDEQGSKKSTYHSGIAWKRDILGSVDPTGEINRSLSYPSLVADHFGIPCHNFAYNGFSMTAIYATLIKNLDKITENTLVIIGMTWSDRLTRFRPEYIQCEPGRQYCFSSDHEEYMMLDMQFGNDILTKLLAVQAMIESIKTLVKCKKIIFVDPVNIYRENDDLGEKFTYFTVKDSILNQLYLHQIDEDEIPGIMDHHDDIITMLTEYFRTELFKYTFAHPISEMMNRRERIKCVIGHPNAAVHKNFAENYLIPYLEKHG